MEAPALPTGMDAFAVRTGNGSETYAVSLRDAAKLAGCGQMTVSQWIRSGAVAVCQHPVEGRLVLVDSLWAALPDEVKR